MKKKLALLATTLAGLIILPALDLPQAQADKPKVVILGIDGMDPRLLDRFLKAGRLPNFSKLIERGDFKPLQTTMPPLSPVAWSTFITGTDPGHHRIFDFLHRDPRSLAPEFALVRTTPSSWNLEIGSWVIPLSGGKTEQLRQGPAFWELLEEKGIPATIYRMPVNFPPSTRGRSLSGMGTPDILGTPGTFSFFTDNPSDNQSQISGGKVYRVEVQDHLVRATLTGPANTFRSPRDLGRGYPEVPDMSTDFQVYLDPEEPVAKLVVQDTEFILQQGEWSDWVPIRFEALPYLVGVSATARFYLQQVRPDFRLYVTPLQISLQDPAMPITNPPEWAGDLRQALGDFYTQELPEETKALSAGIFGVHEFWEQLQFVYGEQRRQLDYALEHFEEGLLFFYFSTVDQGSHMLWYLMDPQHPAFKPDPVLEKAIPRLYDQMDEVLGRVLEAVNEETTVIVMSDHGFAPFYWEVNLNSWLAQKEYVRLLDPTRREGFPLFTNVDWSRTRAYALGLNGLYLNLEGREREGIVSRGEEAGRLLDSLERDLLAMTDPRNGKKVVSFVLRTGRDYPGAHGADQAPDIIVGYAPGYRSSWKNPLGEFPPEIFLDNLDPWSGDHSIDYRQVPGILVTNRKISLDKPTLQDLTVSVLAQFGVSKAATMSGRNCLN